MKLEKKYKIEFNKKPQGYKKYDDFPKSDKKFVTEILHILAKYSNILKEYNIYISEYKYSNNSLDLCFDLETTNEKQEKELMQEINKAYDQFLERNKTIEEGSCDV